MNSLLHQGPAVILATALIAAAPAAPALACGYDDPRSISQSVLNWSYPDSLYVIGAISRGIMARRLPLANFDRPGPDLFGHRYQLTKMSVDQLGEMLRVASPRPSQSAFSLVLVEPMLWTRFEPAADGLRTRVHVSGPEQADLVLVSGEAVIGEIAAGRLTIGEATNRGLIRFYGSDEQKAEFIGAYQSVGGEAPPEPDRDRGPWTMSAELQQAAMRHADPQAAGVTVWHGAVATTPDIGSELGCSPAHH